MVACAVGYGARVPQERKGGLGSQSRGTKWVGRKWARDRGVPASDVVALGERGREGGSRSVGSCRHILQCAARVLCDVVPKRSLALGSGPGY
eukprot:6310635-Prymnesium_polylepis.1